MNPTTLEVSSASEFRLAPYFHPTTVVFLDDNEGFLRSLDLELPEDWPYKIFTHAEPALRFLNNPPELPPLVDRCFTLESASSDRARITLDLSLIEQEINHRGRFLRNSVAMIDFSMPIMDGLEVCAAMTDPYVQKAILTGVADEKVAVQAFNARLIDCFIAKNKSTSVQDIYDHAVDLQQTYFTQYTARLISNLAIDPPKFLLDAAVARKVRQIMRTERVVEYYMISDPPGFLMLRGDGSHLKVLILSDDEYQRRCERAQSWGMPEHLQLAAKERRLIPTFMEEPRDYLGQEPYPWEDNTVAAERVSGDQNWVIGVLDDPPVDINFDRKSSCYDAYVEQLMRERFGE